MTEYLPAYEAQPVSPGFALRRSLLIVRDPLRRARLRWFFLGWAIGVPTLILGAAFTVAGSHVVVAKGVFAIYAKLPGGLHSHGVVMLALGLAMCCGLSMPLFGYPERWEFLRPLLRLISYYYGWSTVMFFLAPAVHNGAFSLLAVVFWGTFAVLPYILLVGPPPALVPKDETDLIRAAVAVGISPAHARALNEIYFHGGDDATD